jgi:hypothetical protein
MLFRNGKGRLSQDDRDDAHVLRVGGKRFDPLVGDARLGRRQWIKLTALVEPGDPSAIAILDQATRNGRPLRG